MLVLHGLFYLLAGFAEETLWRGKLWNYMKEKGMNNVQIFGCCDLSLCDTAYSFRNFRNDASTILFNASVGAWHRPGYTTDYYKT